MREGWLERGIDEGGMDGWIKGGMVGWMEGGMHGWMEGWLD